MDSKSLLQMVDHSRLERIAQHLPDTTDLTLIVLKGHLLGEELLDAIIQSHCKDASVLQGVEIGHLVKIKLAAALTGDIGAQFVWNMCEKLNSLRNALAHKLEHPLAKKRLESFLVLFRNHELEFGPIGSEPKDLRRAIVFLLGCLVAIQTGPSLLDALRIEV